jgi:hypothetical protein
LLAVTDAANAGTGYGRTVKPETSPRTVEIHIRGTPFSSGTTDPTKGPSIEAVPEIPA